MLKLTVAQKAKAIRALRKTKCKQAKGALRHNDGSKCALGIIADAIGVRSEHQTVIIVGNEPRGSWQPIIADWNDEKGLSFKQIADRMEADKEFCLHE